MMVPSSDNLVCCCATSQNLFESFDSVNTVSDIFGCVNKNLRFVLMIHISDFPKNQNF
jgi:hypothetical protein